MKKKVLLSWSSGKDAAWALHVLQTDPDIELQGLFTTLNKTHDRVAMHAVRRELLILQAECTGLPIDILEIPWPCSNEEYAQVMADYVAEAKSRGISHMAFGDLYLEDIRNYRIENLKGTGITPLFPIWGLETAELSREMMAADVKAVLTCCDPKQVSHELAGREYDESLLKDLPETADPCGENGEFHTFVYGGPMFKSDLQIEKGLVVERDGFWFCDILPAS